MERRKPFETFAHYRLGKGNVSLSISVDEGDVQVGVSFSHPRDTFSKSFGRSIAMGRRVKTSNDFSFSFKRNLEQRLTHQVRSEFEKYVADSQAPRAQLAITNLREDWTGAPSWAIHSLNREVRRRNSAVGVIR